MLATEIRYLEAFRLLKKRHQRPQKTICMDYVRDFPIYSEIHALIRGNVFICYIGLVGISVEVLVILLAGVPFSGQMTYNVWKFCSAGTIAIIGLLILTTAWIAWMRRGETLPRLPYSIPAVATHLHSARMLREFGEMACDGVGEGERNRRLKTGGRRMGSGGRWGRMG